MSDIRLVLADVDGTLVTPEKQLTPASIAAVHRLHAAGVRFALTSGRPPRGMAMLIAPLALETPIAAFNGGLIVTPDMQPLQQKTVAPELVGEILGLLDGDLSVWLYQDADWFVTDGAGPHVAKESNTVQFKPSVVPTLSGITERVAKLVGVSDDHPRVAQKGEELQARFGDRVSATRSQAYYLDVTHPDANKGGVVQYLAAHYGLEPSQIATIGDMPNDVLMFERSGLSVAMGQSEASVQAAATHVSASNAEDGFAHAVDRFILG
ncbi:MAG: HAD family phosphatase [Solirubrobacterales bacterium]|nr:HAD family phosphatase [Solirubrobacterales bacterium]